MSMVLQATLLRRLCAPEPGSDRAAPLCRAPRTHAARAQRHWMPPLLLLICGLLLQPAAVDSAAMSSEQHAYHATSDITHHVLMSSTSCSTSSTSSTGSSSSRGVVDAMHMGVSYCKLYLNTSAFENELGGSYQPSQFVLNVFLRFLHNGHTVHVKGFTSVQQLPKDNPWRHVNSAPRLRALLANTDSSHIARLPQRRRTHNARIDPQLQLRVKGSATALPLAGKAIFPYSPASLLKASVKPLNATLQFPVEGAASWDYRSFTFELSAPAANGTCEFSPAVVGNSLDPDGIRIHDRIVTDEALEPSHSHIIMCPFYNVRKTMETLAALLDHNIRWHQALGFSKHVVYMRSDTAEDFAALPAVQHWIQRGRLLLVSWGVLPFYPERFEYDQRIVYNHALLAFTGMNSYLAMIDLDEYIMSLRPELHSFQQMMQQCPLPGSGNKKELLIAASLGDVSAVLFAGDYGEEASDQQKTAHASTTSAQQQAGAATAATPASPPAPSGFPSALQLSRFNAVARDLDRSLPETRLWTAKQQQQRQQMLLASMGAGPGGGQLRQVKAAFQEAGLEGVREDDDSVAVDPIPRASGVEETGEGRGEVAMTEQHLRDGAQQALVRFPYSDKMWEGLDAAGQEAAHTDDMESYGVDSAEQAHSAQQMPSGEEPQGQQPLFRMPSDAATPAGTASKQGPGEAATATMAAASQAAAAGGSEHAAGWDLRSTAGAGGLTGLAGAATGASAADVAGAAITASLAGASPAASTKPGPSIWKVKGAAGHPLSHYSLVNWARPQAVKTVIRPEFAAAFYIHSATQYQKRPLLDADPTCVFVLHLRSLWRIRPKDRDRYGSDQALRSYGFVDDDRLKELLAARIQNIEQASS